MLFALFVKKLVALSSPFYLGFFAHEMVLFVVKNSEEIIWFGRFGISLYICTKGEKRYASST